MAGYDHFKHGNVSYPLAAQTAGASLLTVCDPAVAKLLDYFKFEIGAYLSTALTGAAGSGNAPISANVADTIPIDPQTIAKIDQFKFPLLAVWRKSSKYDGRTVNWRQDVSRIGVAYILPPLTAGQSVKTYAVLTSIARIVDHALHLGFDPAYNSGEKVIYANNIEFAKLISAEYTRFEFGDTMDFHAWIGEVEMGERVNPTLVGIPTWTGDDAQITDESVTAGSPIDLVDTATDSTGP